MEVIQIINDRYNGFEIIEEVTKKVNKEFKHISSYVFKRLAIR